MDLYRQKQAASRYAARGWRQRLAGKKGYVISANAEIQRCADHGLPRSRE
jgi:hypothetical protein